MEITAADWQTIRGVFREGFATGFHFAVATVDDDGFPQVTPIGSLVLGEVGRAIYTESYALGLGKRLERDPRLCVSPSKQRDGEAAGFRSRWPRGDSRPPSRIVAGRMRVQRPQQCLNFLPEPQGQGSLRPTRGVAAAGSGRCGPGSMAPICQSSDVTISRPGRAIEVRGVERRIVSHPA